MHDHLLILHSVEVVDTVGQLAKGNQRTANIVFGVFVGFAHVDEVEFFAFFQTLAEFLYGDIHS